MGGLYFRYFNSKKDKGCSSTVVAEAGSFMMMDADIQMNTIFGDGSQQQQNGGILGKLMGAGKRLLTGESLFMTAFTNVGNSKRFASFAAPYTGKIIALDNLVIHFTPSVLVFYRQIYFNFV